MISASLDALLKLSKVTSPQNYSNFWFIILFQDNARLKGKFPIGMLGIHFNVDLDNVLNDVIPLAIQVQFSIRSSPLVS